MIQLFMTFFKLGIFTIGGGLAMIPLLHEEIVSKKGWLSEEEMVDCLSVSQSLPGVIAINMATYIGYRKHGLYGALVSTIGVITPSIAAIIAIIELLEQVADSHYISGAISGVKAVAVALILLAAYGVSKQVLTKWYHWIMAVGTFLAVAVLGASAIWTIMCGAVIGIALALYSKRGS